MRKLSKRDVEALLAEYDNNPAGALLTSLQVLIPNCPTKWEDAVEMLNVEAATKANLRACTLSAMDELVKQLVETRGLQQR